MRVLVTYATRSGCTTGIAEKIASAIRCRRAGRSHPGREQPNPDGYDAYVIGSGVRGMRWYKPARDWVEAHSEELANKPVAFFSVGLEAVRFPRVGHAHRRRDVQLADEYRHRADRRGLLQGLFRSAPLSRGEIRVVGAMGVPEGDYREWDFIEEWARDIAAKFARRLEQTPMEVRSRRSWGDEVGRSVRGRDRRASRRGMPQCAAARHADPGNDPATCHRATRGSARDDSDTSGY